MPSKVWNNTTHVGKRGSRSVVRLARISGDMLAGRRHVDIAFHFPDAAPLVDGSFSECMSRTQARVLARRILEAAK